MGSEHPIRVLIVDDHAVVRRGLEAFLQAYDDLELVGEAADGAEAITLCERLAPDVVLMDLLLGELDGAEATRQIRRRHPHTQVIALTSVRDELWVQRALAAGAIAYLLKNADAQELAAAIRRAASGRPTLGPEATEALIHASLQEPPVEELTSREREVLALMSKGLSNPEIARKLVVSRSTVKFHVSSILGKLGTASRTEAVVQAIERHLV
jgi:NarL family two-component system response regulator LiaR